MKKILLESKGFILLEQITSVVIVGIISSSMILFLCNVSLTFDHIKSRKVLTANNTSGIEQFSRELRLAYNIITINSKTIQFTATADTNLLIDYKINTNNTITRKIGGGNNQLVSENVDYSNSYFQYYDSNGNVGTPIRRIRLSLLYSANSMSSPLTIDISPYTFR